MKFIQTITKYVEEHKNEMIGALMLMSNTGSLNYEWVELYNN